MASREGDERVYVCKSDGKHEGVSLVRLGVVRSARETMDFFGYLKGERFLRKRQSGSLRGLTVTHAFKIPQTTYQSS